MEAPTRIKKYSYFIGIDVSKNEHDFAVMQGARFLYHKEILNEVSEISEFLEELKLLPKFILTRCIFCMDCPQYNGSYSNQLEWYYW